MSKRPKRRVLIKSKAPIQPPRKWKDEEMETLLKCIMEYGHKDLDKIHEHLPRRTIDNIKTFIRTIHDTAGKLEREKDVVEAWIKQCEGHGETPWKDCIQIAQVFKYLSIDGLLENHPLPERCQGIDFRQAYQLIYQALMGYPMQPINKATADFVLESIAELSGEIRKQTDAIKKVESFLNSGTSAGEQTPSVIKRETSSHQNGQPLAQKPLKVYKRKKSVLPNSELKPCLKILVEEIPGSGDSSSGCSKDFAVAVEGNDMNVQTTVNVPVPYRNEVNADELELLKSSSYNPFRIPEKWLKEPLYVNLLQPL